MPSRRIAKLALVATALMLAILASSAYLRLSAIQGGCAPGSACVAAAGAEQAPHGVRSLARAAHRLSASAVAVVALLLAALSWLRREGTRETRWVALLLVTLTAFLAVLGATAGGSSAPAVTLGNLLAGNAIAGAAWWLYARNRLAPPPAARAVRRMAAGAAAALAVAAVLFALATFSVAPSLSVGTALAQNLAASLALLACVWLSARIVSPRH